jgi:hypothetical protein
MLVGPPYIAELFLPDFASQCFAGQLVWCIHRGLVCAMLARSLLVASLKPIALFAPLGCRKQKEAWRARSGKTSASTALSISIRKSATTSG